jgi:plastocyanin
MRTAWPGRPHIGFVQLLVFTSGLVAACTGATSTQLVPPATPTSDTLPATSAPPRPSPTTAALVVGETTPASSAPPGAISLRADSNSFAYQQTGLWAKTGTVSVFISNVAPEGQRTGRQHNMAIGTSLGEPLLVSDSISEGKSAVFTIEDLPPGNYVFFCTISDAGVQHYQLGMVGALTVNYSGVQPT